MAYSPHLPMHYNDETMDLSLDTDVEWANRDSLISPQTTALGSAPFHVGEEDEDGQSIEKGEELIDVHTKLERALAENKSLTFRLFRRAGIIQEIKDSYLRDIVVMKNAMAEHLTAAGAAEVVALWKDAIPSIDFTQSLALHAPTLSELKIKPCRTCGGSLDIEFHDSEKYNRIYAKMVKISGRNEELRLALATQAVQFDQVQTKVRTQHQEHEREKKFLYEEIRMTKDKLAEALEKVTATEAQMKHVHHESVQIKKSNQMLVENVKDHQILETRAEESENLVAKLRIQLDQAQELNNYQEKQIAEKNSRVSLLEKSGHETEETSQALQAMLESTKMALGMAIDENDSLKAKASRDAKDIATFQLMINPLNEEIRNLKHEHAIDSETHEQLTDSLRSDLRSIEAQYNQLKKEVPRVTEEMMNLQRTVEELQAVIKEKDELLDEAATREQNLQGELLTLHQVNDDLLRDLTVARDKELRGKYSSNKGGGSNNGGGSSGAMGIGGTGALGRLAAMSIHEDDEPGEDFFNLRPALSLETNDGSSDADGSSGHAGAPMEIVPGSVDDVNVGSGTNRRFNLDSPGNKGTMDYSDVSLSVAERRARKNLTRLKTGELAVESGVGIRHQKSLRNFKHKKKKEPIIEPDGSIAAGTSAAGGDSESEEVEDDDEEEEEREGKLEVDVSSPVGGPGLSPGALSTNAAAQKQYNIRKYDVTPKPRVVSSRAGPNSRTRNGSGVGPGSGASGGGGMDDAEMMAELTAAKFSRPGGGPLSSYSSPVGRGGGSSNRTPQRNASVARRPSAIGSTGFRPQENVDLVSVREGATDEEIAMRDAILATLTATVGPIPAKKAINALTPVLALYGTLLTDALAGMWDSMVANKKASDFFCKTNIILERMLACTPENGITSYEVGKTCQDCIPLAMTSIGGGGGLVNSWHELTQINEHVVHDLGGTINYQTGEVTFKTYSDFFGHDEDHYLLKMEAAGIALAKMGIYGDEAVKALNTNMIALLKDWNEAKSTFIDIDSIVEEEKKIVRQAADREINSIIAELSNTFARLEVAKEAVKEGNKKVEVQTVELTTLRPLPQKLETSEQKVKDLLGKIKHITAEAEEVMVEHKNLKHHVVELNETITVQKSELVHIHQVEEQLRDNIVVLEETAVRSEARNVEVSKALDKVVTENHNRLHALNHVHVQTQPFHSDAGIQTEFICPPMSLRTAAKLNNTSKTTHYPLVFSSFPEESREHSGIPAIVTGSGASELPVTVDINEIISAEASALASRMKHPIAGSGSSKTLQKFRSIGNMANPVTPSEQVRALSASADTLRQRVGNSGSTRRQGDSRFDNHSHGHGHGHDPFPSSPDRDTTRTQTPHHRHHHHHLPDFSDDLVDDVSLITAGTATMIEQDHLAVMPRDNNTSLVVKPASANTIHQFREFGGIVSMEPDIGSLLSHKSPDSSSRGRHGQGQGSLTHSQSLDNGFAPGSISLHSLSGGGDGFGVDHDWASVLSVTDNRGNSADGHNNSNSSGNNSAGRGDGDPDRGGDRDRGGGGVTISTTSESVQETWMKAASPAGKPLDTVVNTFKVGSSARRGVKNSGGARARVDSTGSTGTNENKYYIGQGSPLNGGALSSGGGDGSHATFNLPVLSAYGLSMNHSLQNNNQIFSNRPSTGGAGVGVVSGVNRSIHHAAVNSGSVSVSSKSVGIKRVAHSSQGHSRSGNLR